MRTISDRSKAGRPPGRQHDVTIHVRLPKPTYTALKRMATYVHGNVAQVVRAGIDAKIGELAGICVDIARDETTSPCKRLRAIKLIRLMTMGELYLSPTGLKLARAAALEKKGKHR